MPKIIMLLVPQFIFRNVLLYLIPFSILSTLFLSTIPLNSSNGTPTTSTTSTATTANGSSSTSKSTISTCRTLSNAATAGNSRIDRLTCLQYATAQLTPHAAAPGASGRGKLVKPTATNKNTIAFAGDLIGQRGRVSTTLRAYAQPHLPTGATLFPTNSALAGQVDALAQAISTTAAFTKENLTLSKFLPMFRKVQFMVLNDLYIYLTSIYATFNLTHADSLNNYETTEPTHALNKKALIVDHLLNTIQAQMFYICSHFQPLVPQQLAIRTGSLLLQHDNTVDPLFLITDFTKPLFSGDLTTSAQKAAHTALQQAQSAYLSTFKQIIMFFNQFTNYLTQPDSTSKLSGVNAFTPLAQTIASVVANDPYAKGVENIIKNYPTTPYGTKITSLAEASNQASTKKIAALRALRQKSLPINPPIFYYDFETVRATQVIPRTAALIGSSSLSIPWPAQLVKAATKGTPAMTRAGGQFGKGEQLGYPVAYFETAQQVRTRDPKKAARLFINLPTVNGPYAQEIKKQPAWLNSQTGIINILRGCLGDYTQLIGKNIVSPCTEQILCAVLGTPCAHQATLGNCQSYMNLINTVQQSYMTALETGKATTTTSQTGSSDYTPTQGVGQYLSGSGSGSSSSSTGTSQSGIGS